MEKLLTIIATCLLVGTASAQSYGFGNSLSGTSTRYGSTTYHNFSGSGGLYLNGTSTQYGGTIYHNFSGNGGLSGSGTSTRYGGTTYHNFNW